MPDTILTFLDNDLTMAGAAYGIASVNAAGDLAVVTTTTAAAEINWFPWDGAALGAKSTNGNPVGLDRHVAIHPIDDVVAIMNLSDRRVRVYNITGGALGTLIATSDAGTGASILGLRWAPDGSAIAVLGSLSPYVSVWTWDGAALGARVSPAAASVAPTSVATDGIAWSPGSDAVAYAIGLGDIAVSTWDGAALGAPSEPGGALTFTTGVGATGTDFSPDGTQIALCGDNQPFVAVYAWDGSAVGSTAVDVPTTTAGGGFAQTVRFGRQGQNIFLGGSGLDGGLVLYAYPWDGAVFGVRIDADTPPLAGAAVIGIALSPDNSTLFVMDTFEDLTVYNTALTLAPPAPGTTYLAAAFDAVPYLRVWPFDKTADTFGPVAIPAVTPGSDANAVKFHPTDDYIAVSSTLTPFVHVYNFDPATGAIGAKVANPATLPPGEGFGVSWHPSGLFLAIIHRLAPFVSIYNFDPITGTFGAKLANPATAHPNFGLDVSFDPSGLFIGQTYFASPFAAIYAFDPVAPAWGAKVANPATLPGNFGGSFRFNPDGNLVVVTWGSTAAPEIGAWPFDPVTPAWGARVEPPDVATNDEHNRAVFNADSTRIIVGQNINFGGPVLYAYEFDPVTPAFGARMAAAAPAPNDNVLDAAFDVAYEYVASGWLPILSAGMGVWPWTDVGGYGTRLSDPPSVPRVNVNGTAWSQTAASPPTPPVTAAPQPLQSTEREALRVLGVARGIAPVGPGAALEVTLGQLLDTLRGDTTSPGRYPTDADRLFDLIFAELGIARPRYVKRNGLLAVIEANLP